MLQIAPALQVSLARSEDDIRAAQRLRYIVFVQEFGSRGTGVDVLNCLETDSFDNHADHLILRDARQSDTETRGVVGTYRLMTQDHANAAGGFYSASEFDLTPLLVCGKRLLELGRTCLHPEYRRGPGLMLLWQGLADYVAQRGIQLLFGTASFPGTDLTRLQHPISHLHANYLTPQSYRVASWQEQTMPLLPEDRIERKSAMRDTPALIKSYLKLGGTIGQGVYVDEAFNTTDVCLILPTDTASFKPAARPDRPLG